MSYSPARLDGKIETDMQNDPPTPSWFPLHSEEDESRAAEKAESLVAKYRERATMPLSVPPQQDAEGDALAAYREKLDAKLAGSVRINPDMEKIRITESRQPRAAITMDDESLNELPIIPVSRRRRAHKSNWPGFLAMGLCAMIVGGSLGYGVAQKDKLDSLLTAATASITALMPKSAQTAAVPVAAASSAPVPTTADASGASTMAPQVASPAAAPDPLAQKTAPAAPQLADTSQNQRTATALPEPIAPGDNLVAKADGLMAQGDVASARQLYLQADGMGNAKGTYGVARSYDPKVFQQLGVTGLQPEASKAADWYRKAADAGVSTSQ